MIQILIFSSMDRRICKALRTCRSDFSVSRRHGLQENVQVHSLGKENVNRRSLFTSLVYAIRFKFLIFKLRKQYDKVFVHMNPEYVILGGIFWRLWKKRIGLWYLHRSVTLKLRVAAFLTNVIFTASKESFRLKSRKVQIVGHGIDVSQFTTDNRAERVPEPPHQELRIITTGRIAPAKRLMEMLDALDVLHARNVPFHFTIVGGPATPADKQYMHKVQEAIASRTYHDQVSFIGATSHERIPALLADADVFLNLSTTGSVDKAVLEAFASGIPAVTSNVSFNALLEPHGLFIPEDHSLLPASLNPEKTANALEDSSKVDAAPFRSFVENTHSLAVLIPRVLELL